MELNYIQLKFGDHPLHFSDGRGLYYSTDGQLQSDTLKNAIFTSAAKLFGKSVLTEAFYDSFRVSSAFPYYGDHLFFPRPLGSLAGFGLTEKADKKVTYLSKSLFENWINGEETPVSIWSMNDGAFLVESVRLQDKVLQIKQAQDRVNLTGPIAQPYYFCLLYTSPSPRDATLSRMPSSA